MREAIAYLIIAVMVLAAAGGLWRLRTTRRRPRNHSRIDLFRQPQD